MDQTFLMCLHDIRRKQETACNVFADLSCHIITLHAVYNRIFVGIFLFDFFVVAFYQSQDLFIR